MKLSHLFIWVGLCILPGVTMAQDTSTKKKQREWWNNNPAFSFKLNEVSVTARPFKDIGIQKTKLDSLVLHENIALSLADVLTFNSSIFIKQYGRATLSTVAFRGTAASHTQVTWNGMKINSPMLGMTDFSMIPSYFIDDASLLHGTSSVNVAGGGLGGAVVLSTQPAQSKGFGLQYVQGIGSFKTFDEFLRLTYGNDRWQSSTRVVYSSSENRFKFRNRDKNENIYDDDHNIIGTYHPIEENRSGSFKDLHLLQEVYYNTGKGDRFGMNAWYIHSDRNLPQTTVDYGNETDFINKQREHTLRSVFSWDHMRKNYKIGTKAGYIHTWMAYDYARDKGNGNWAYMTRSRSRINTFYLQGDGEYHVGDKWLFTANVGAYQHLAQCEDRNILLQDGGKAVVGYDKGRVELSAYLSAKWRPTERLGLSLVVREDLYGTAWTPIIPAFYTDFLLSKKGNILAKASISKNYRFPTLNDLYFLPGGNPDLKEERGFTYDAGLSFSVGKSGKYALRGEATWFDSYINDWIIWFPNGAKKDFWTPRNLKKVHAYGVELKSGLEYQMSEDWGLGLDGNFSWTPSINKGEPISPGDLSVGKQLVYVPKYSTSATGRLSWRSWRFLYKWCYYSERFTMSSNDYTITGYVPPYYMSDVSLEKQFSFRWANASIKLSVKNLLNEEYLSVLARPMPRRNFEVFFDIRPKWHKK